MPTTGVKSYAEGEGVYSNDRRQTWRPGKCFLALAERGVNILAFQSYVEAGESLARFVADDMASAKAVLGGLVGKRTRLAAKDSQIESLSARK